jgi:hypothetical protein
MVEASDHGYVLHTRRIHVTQHRIRIQHQWQLAILNQFADGLFHRFAASERYVNGVEVFIFEYYRTTLTLAVPKFAARNS